MSATIIVDLGFGDAGKGSLVDFLCDRRRTSKSVVVRFNGGAQAAHHVVTPTGTHHEFAQFGSGALVGASTHLSRFMVVDPLALWNEAQHLKQLGLSVPFSRLTVDSDALVVTPFHIMANRGRELQRECRGECRHGSVGVGIGETVYDSLYCPEISVRVADLANISTLRYKLSEIRDLKVSQFVGCINSFGSSRTPTAVAERMYEVARDWTMVGGGYLKDLAMDSDLIFEGAQGVLLDEWYGFHPHTTWSTCTFENADILLKEIGYQGSVTRIGALRAYGVRHGLGPFPTEDEGMKGSNPSGFHEIHNSSNHQWQGKFRVGWFDEVLAKYALDVCGGVDFLAITNVDRFGADFGSRFVCNSYKRDGGQPIYELRKNPIKGDLSYQVDLTNILGEVVPSYKRFPDRTEDYLRELQNDLGYNVGIVSSGPTREHKKAWDFL